MADLEDGLYAYLKTVTALTNLVSTRIYPVKAPQGAAKPYMVYSRIGGGAVHNLGSDSGYTETRLQFDIWGSTYLSVKNVARQLQTALQDRTSTLSTTTIDRVIGPEIEADGYDYEADCFHRWQEYEVWYVQG